MKNKELPQDIELIESFLSRISRNVTRERMPMVANVQIFDGISSRLKTNATKYTIASNGRRLEYTYHVVDERIFDGACLHDVRVFDAGDTQPWYSNQSFGTKHIPSHLRSRLRMAAILSRNCRMK